MKLFTKKETAAQNMAFMGLMSAISIIITLLLGLTDTFFIGLSLFVTLLLPLVSTIVELCCKDKYYPIYFLATLGLSLATTFWNIQSVILYLLPSLISGYLFGLSAKYKVSPIWAIITASLVNTGINLLTIPLINYIFEINIIRTFLVFFSLESSPNIPLIIPAFILVISLMQMTLSYFISKNEIKKFGYEYIEENKSSLYISLATIISSLIIIGCYFFNLSLCYLLLIVSIYFAITLLVTLAVNRYWMILSINALPIIVAIILYALCHRYLKIGSSLLLYGVAPLLVGVINLVFCFLNKKESK